MSGYEANRSRALMHWKQWYFQRGDGVILDVIKSGSLLHWDAVEIAMILCYIKNFAYANLMLRTLSNFVKDILLSSSCTFPLFHTEYYIKYFYILLY